ncbi:MAG: two-component regulator propeller domain-containing protein [Bacteroidota bacterium]
MRRFYTAVPLFSIITTLVFAFGEKPVHPVSFDKYVITNYTADNGLPQNTVDLVDQSSDGYIWIGTYAGLARYDGVKFIHFNRSITPAFKINHVTVMHQDKSGASWFGTNGGGIVRYAKHTFSSVEEFNSGGKEYIKSIQSFSPNELIVGTERGGIHTVRVSDSGAIQEIVPFLDKQLPKNILFRTMLKAGKTIYIATDIGLITIDGQTIRKLTTANALPNNSITALAVDQNNTVWVGTSNGLARIVNGYGSIESFSTSNGLTNNSIRSLFVDKENTLWIGTDGGGLNRFIPSSNGPQFDALTSDNGLVNNFIRTIFQDSEENIWIGTRNGLSQLHIRKFELFGKKSGLSDSYVRTVLEDSKHRLWVGTNGSGLNCLDGRSVKTWNEKQLPNMFIRALYEDHNGLLWIGTDGGGVIRYDESKPVGKQFKYYNSANGLTENYIRAFEGGFDNDLYVATYGGGISRIKGDSVIPLTTRQGLANDNILAMVRSYNNEIWVGTNGGGINRITPRGIETYSTKDGLSNNFILCMFVDKSGALWIGTNGGGINRFADGKFQSFTTKDGLREDVTLMIIEDDAGFLWIGGNQGITRIPKAEFQKVADGTLKKFSRIDFGRSDGLQNAEISGVSSPSIIKASDGKIWFTTVGGLAMVDTNRIVDQINTFPLHVEEIRVNDQTYYPDSTLEIAPGYSSVEFHYTGLSYMSPERIRFRYKLDGFDANWNDAGVRRTAYYTNIPPGSYTFRVSASIDGGIWSTDEATSVVVFEPYFHQTPYFGFLVGIGLIILGAGLYAMRTANVHRHAKHLKSIVDDRTKELVETKEKIEQHLKEVESTRDELSRINTRLDKANKEKSDLLGILSHDFKNKVVNLNHFAHTINDNQYNQTVVQEHSQLMEQTTHYMLKLIEDTLSSSALEQGQLVVKKSNVDIVQLVELAVLKNRILMQQKSQTIGFSTSAETCIVSGSERWLNEAVENLINNAGKFSDAGTTIDVSIAVNDQTVQIKVKDQGPGLTDDDQKQLFQQFTRLSAQPTGGEISTGLGLAIVKKIVEKHNGKVSAESIVNQGSTFIIELPVYRPL